MLQIENFKKRLFKREYTQINKTLTGVIFEDRNKALKKKILPFVTKFNLEKLSIKQVLSKNWYLIQIQPLKRLIKHEFFECSSNIPSGLSVDKP